MNILEGLRDSSAEKSQSSPLLFNPKEFEEAKIAYPVEIKAGNQAAPGHHLELTNAFSPNGSSRKAFDHAEGGANSQNPAGPGNYLLAASGESLTLDDGDWVLKDAKGVEIFDLTTFSGQPRLPNAVTSFGGAAPVDLQISSGSMKNYDGKQSDMSAVQKDIIAEANKDVGSAMWSGWIWAYGGEGCAASVSQILDNSGAANLHNAQDDNCDGMQADLLAQGWQITNKPQPGDVWVGRGGRSSMHTGIVGENFTLLDNNSASGFFHRDNANMTNEWQNSVFLEPAVSKGTTGGVKAQK